jgi:hypothetical protein
MIICASHLTLRDLFNDPRPAQVKHLADVLSLVAQVIEFKYHNVRLPAVNA